MDFKIMPYKFLNEINTNLESIDSYLDCQGVSVEEIARLEGKLGFKIPLAYKEFLTSMGKNHFPLFNGSETEFNKLDKNFNGARLLLEECHSFLELPQNALVIQFHQGYMFWFILMSEEDNPPVYGFNESDITKFDTLFPTYLDYLNDEVHQVINLPRKTLNQMKKLHDTGKIKIN